MSEPAAGKFIPLSKLPHFDPREVPVAGIDSHLPAVDPGDFTPAALRARFANPPRWEPEVRNEPMFTDRPFAHASVLVGIVARDEPTLILTERTAHLTTHSGQVALPGGKRDESDVDAAHTALREAEEEVGLDPARVEVLGSLSTYRTGSGFIITPVVALVDPSRELRANPDEVADVFEVPFAFLMNPAHHRRHVFEFEGMRREWFSMPYMDGATQRFVWGATAGVLRNLYRFLRA